MDVVSAISGYISKMVSAGDTTTGSSSKMKILLLDSETVRVLENNFIVSGADYLRCLLCPPP